MIKRIRGLLPKGGFIANVLTLMTGTVSAQAISILAIPVIARLYGLEDFGAFALFVSVVDVISVVACWRYEEAIVLPKEDEQAANILVLSLLIAIVMSVITLVIMTVGINTVIQVTQLSFWLWFIPIAVFCRGVNLIFSYWSIRKKQFRLLAVSRTAESVTRIAVQMAAGLTIGSSAGGLIGGQILGVVLSTAIIGFPLCGGDSFSLLRGASVAGIRAVALTYKKFPYYLSWTGLLNRVAQQEPLWFFEVFYTRAVVGSYSMGHRVLSLPTALVTQSIQRVYLQKSAEMSADGKPVRASFVKSTLGLVAVGAVPFLALLLFGRPLFALAFGPKWYMAGLYAQLMSPWLFTAFITAPARTLFTVYQKQDVLLVFQICFTLFGALAILAGHFFFGTVEWCILLFSGVGLLFNLGMVGYSYRLVTTMPGEVNSQP